MRPATRSFNRRRPCRRARQQAPPPLEALTRQHPDDARITRLLADTRFKANLETHTRVRSKRWNVPWRAITLRLLMVGAVAVLLALGAALVQVRALPMLAGAQEQRSQAQLLTQGENALALGDFEAASGYFERLLAEVPEHPDALAGLAKISSERSPARHLQ